MKKLLTIVLLVSLVAGALFAQSIYENPEGMKKIIILNNAFEGLEASRQCYNAKEWHKSYSLGQIIDDNLWFTPADDAIVSTVAYADLYTDTCDLATFRGKLVSLIKDNPEYDYDLFVGPNQKESSDVWYKGWCIVGNEALVFENVAGKSVTLTAEQLASAQILYVDGSITLICGDVSLADVQSVTVAGITKASKVEGDGVYRMVMVPNAVGVYGVDAPLLGNRAGTWYPTATTAKHKYAGAYSVADLFAKFDITPCDSVQVVSYADGYAREEEYVHFTKKYIAWHASAEYITMGMEQSRKEDAVYNAGFYILKDEAFVYIPEAGNGINLGEVFAKIGMADVVQYKLSYADGTVMLVYNESIPNLYIPAESDLVTIEAM
jgi:hypothetical protein